MTPLKRSANDQVIAGICSGIGHYYGVDSNLVRMATVFVTILTGFIPMVVTYTIGWALIPEDD